MIFLVLFFIEIAVGFQQVDIPDSSYLQHHGMFDLSWNHLSGSIPEELRDCIVIVDLLLNNNNLIGVVPKSLAHLTNLTTLDLSYNNVVSEIPREIATSKKLQGLALAYNKLNGTIPPELGDLSSLVKMNLTGNRLHGKIPDIIGKLNGLSHLDVIMSSHVNCVDLLQTWSTSLVCMYNKIGYLVALLACFQREQSGIKSRH